MVHKLVTRNEIDETGNFVYLEDDTDYSSDLRSDYALFPVGVAIQANGKELPILFTAYDPLVASTWTAKIPKDGWLKFNLVSVKSVNRPNPDNYVIGDIVYSKEYATLYKKVREGTNPFEKIDPKELLASGSTSSTLEQFFIARSSLVLIDLTKQLVESYINSESLSLLKKIHLLQDQYNKVRSIIQASVYQYAIGNKFAAQRYIEFLQTNNYETFKH